MASLSTSLLSAATLSAVLMCSMPGFSQDLISQEITIVDAACKERKMAACIAEATFTVGVIPGTCPTDSSQVSTTPSPDGNSTLIVCKITDISKVTTHPQLAEGIQRCKDLVDNFPSYYGQSCLRPLGFERMTNALSADLPKVFAQMCEAVGGTNCAKLNEVPGVE